jgi:Fungal Zn(2)-Cys(6) binuclear cluster domain
MSSPEDGRSIGRSGYARGSERSMINSFAGNGSPGDSPENTSASSSKKRKLEPSCQACYLRKIKCDKKKPVCSSCVKRDIHVCEYIDRRELEPSELPPARKPSSHGIPHSRPQTPLPTSASAGSVYNITNGAYPNRYYAQPPHPPGASAPMPSLDLANMPEDQLEGLLDRVATILSKKLNINGGGGSSSKDSTGNRVYDRSRRPANSSPLVPILAAETGSPELEAWAWDALMSLPSDETIDFAVTFYCVSGRKGSSRICGQRLNE